MLAYCCLVYCKSIEFMIKFLSQTVNCFFKVGVFSMERSNLPDFYCYSLYSQKNSHINLLQIGMHKCEPKYSYSHYRDMYVIHIVKSGIATVETGGHRYTLKENDVYLVRPYELIVQTSDSNKPCELYFFAFNGNLSEEILSKTVFKNNITFSTLKDETLYQKITDYAYKLNGNPDRNLLTYNYLFDMLSYFGMPDSYELTPKNNADSYYQKYISTIQEYIQSNYSKSIKISDLAIQLGLSRSHLYRIFKADKGISIEEYLIEVRINAARSLLTDTQFSCVSIASLVGYSHYTTFFRIFKQKTGLTPQQYRAKKGL